MKSEEVERAVDNLSHKENRRRRGIGISKKMAVGVFAVMIAATLITSGALLSYYGSIQTTATVEQSVVVREPGGNWLNYDIPIDRTLGTTEHPIVSCNDYTYKAWIWNRACSEAPVGIDDECTLSPIWDNGYDHEGFDITHYIIGDTQTIELREKTVVFGTAPWKLVGTEGTVGANVTFSTCDKVFNGEIKYWGLDAIGYSLIYYKDINPRWEGEGVATVLHTFTGGATGTETFSHSSTASFPTEDDYNAGPDINYGLTGAGSTGDDYEHINGAKLWIVPSTELSGTSVAWTGASDYLWETDLALYIDCDDITPIWIPLVYDEFDTTILQPESEYCWLTNYHVALDIWPGIYAFNTWLNPTS